MDVRLTVTGSGRIIPRYLIPPGTVIRGTFPGVLTIAEESTAWPKVTGPIERAQVRIFVFLITGHFINHGTFQMKIPVYV